MFGDVFTNEVASSRGIFAGTGYTDGVFERPFRCSVVEGLVADCGWILALAVSEDQLPVRSKCTCIIFDILVYAGKFCIMMFTS